MIFTQKGIYQLIYIRCLLYWGLLLNLCCPNKCIHTHSSFQITANVNVLYKAYFQLKNKHKIDWGSLWSGRIFSKRNSKSVPCVCIHAFLFQYLFIRNIMQLIVLRKPVLNSLTVCFSPCIVCKSVFSLKRISKILKITLIMTVWETDKWQENIFSPLNYGH